MTSPVHRLDWDSVFFSMEIGRANCNAPLAGVVAEARSLGLACVYVEADRGDLAPPAGAELVHVDHRVRLRRAAGDVASGGTEVRPGAVEDVGRLTAAIEALVPWSRFSRDPRFGVDAARRMYVAWLTRAARSKDELLAVGDYGFVTVSTGPSAQIGLIATSAPGRGHGRALLDYACAWAAPAPVEVATQADNAASLALYRSRGFVEVERSHVFHLWPHDA